MARRETFSDVVARAIADIASHGFDSEGRIEFWTTRLREAAARTMRPEHVMQQMLRDGLSAVYRRLVEKGGVAAQHPGVSRFTLDKVRPHLRAELDRRIAASASLIRLNRGQRVEETLRRFQGWATSVPVGGTDAARKTKVKQDIGKALRALPFDERRVLIDQGHKLTAAISETVASDGGAIAVIWHSHWRQAGYDYREDHKERDGNVYLLKQSWARERGLVKPSKNGYYDDITKVAEEVFCRCFAQWIYSLRDLPAAMLTRKGADALAEAKRKVAA